MTKGLQLPLVRFCLRFYGSQTQVTDLGHRPDGGSNNGFPAGVLVKDFGFGIVPQTIPLFGLKNQNGRGITAGATTAENLVCCSRGDRDNAQQKKELLN